MITNDKFGAMLIHAGNAIRQGGTKMTAYRHSAPQGRYAIACQRNSCYATCPCGRHPGPVLASAERPEHNHVLAPADDLEAMAPYQMSLEDAINRLDVLRPGEQYTQFFGIDGRLKLIVGHPKTLLLPS